MSASLMDMVSLYLREHTTLVSLYLRTLNNPLIPCRPTASPPEAKTEV